MPALPHLEPARFDFLYGAVASRDFPALAWRRAYQGELLRQQSSLYYAPPEGDQVLRMALQGYLRRARGLVCDAGQILVVHGSQQAIDLWIAGFRMTYGAELRPESADRATHIVATDSDRYVAVTPLALAVLAQRNRGEAALSPRPRRILGKLLNVARLIKGAFTFEGGLDYILWKIARHSGVTLTATDWQRRHPLLAAPGLAWRLYRRGAFR